MVADSVNTLFNIASAQLPRSPRLLRADQPDLGEERRKYQWLYGTCVRHPFENGYHRGTIGFAGVDPQGNPILVWSNAACYSWKLYPDASNRHLWTKQDNPYFTQNPQTGKTFELVYNDAGQLQGFIFQTEMYSLAR